MTSPLCFTRLESRWRYWNGTHPWHCKPFWWSYRAPWLDPSWTALPSDYGTLFIVISISSHGLTPKLFSDYAILVLFPRMKSLPKFVYRSLLILVCPIEKCKTCNWPDFASQAIPIFGTVPTASKFDKSSRVWCEHCMPSRKSLPSNNLVSES